MIFHWRSSFTVRTKNQNVNNKPLKPLLIWKQEHNQLLCCPSVCQFFFTNTNSIYCHQTTFFHCEIFSCHCRSHCNWPQRRGAKNLKAVIQANHSCCFPQWITLKPFFRNISSLCGWLVRSWKVFIFLFNKLLCVYVEALRLWNKPLHYREHL